MRPIALVLLLTSFTACSSGASTTGGATPDTSASTKPVGSSTPMASAERSARPQASSSASGAATYTFKTRPAAVGDKATTSETSSSDLNLEVSGHKIHVQEEVEKERLVEVLAVGGQYATKAKVTYTKYKSTSTKDGKSDPEIKLEGKSYIVERKGDALVVTDANGATVPKDEEKVVSKDMKSLGKPDDVTVALDSKPRKVGDSLDDVADALAKKMTEDGDGSGSKAEAKGAHLKLVSVDHVGDHDVGNLEFSVDVVMKNKKMDMTMAMKGTGKFRTDDSDIGELNMTAPVTMTGEVTGSGTIMMSEKGTR